MIKIKCYSKTKGSDGSATASSRSVTNKKFLKSMVKKYSAEKTTT